jgi:hypothetical protein
MKDLVSFLSAWQIYQWIRVAFAPERGPGLIIFTAHVHLLSQNQDFSNVGPYLLTYLRLYQNAAPERWSDPWDRLYGPYFLKPPTRPPPSRAPTIISPPVAAGGAARRVQRLSPISSSILGLPATSEHDFNSAIFEKIRRCYIVAVNQAIHDEDEKIVKEAKEKGLPVPPPLKLNETEVPMGTLRRMMFFIYCMDYGDIPTTLADRKPFFERLSVQADPNLYPPFPSVVDQDMCPNQSFHQPSEI